MNHFKQYVEYLKDNPQKYWFKRKLYGWGWTPATWQGWLVLFASVALLVLNAIRIDKKSHSVSDTLINFLPQTFVILMVLIAICYKKGRGQSGNGEHARKEVTIRQTRVEEFLVKDSIRI